MRKRDYVNRYFSTELLILDFLLDSKVLI